MALSSKGGEKPVRRGFSLVELMVVVVILSILIGFIANEVADAIRSAKVEGLKKNLRVIRDAIRSYRADKGAYPDSFHALTDAHPPYLMEIPIDPVTEGANWMVRPEPFNLLAVTSSSTSYAVPTVVSAPATGSGIVGCTSELGDDARLFDGRDSKGENYGDSWVSVSGNIKITVDWGKSRLIEKIIVIFEDKPHYINSLTLIGGSGGAIVSSPVYVPRYEYVLRTSEAALSATGFIMTVEKAVSIDKDSNGDGVEDDWVVEKVRSLFARNSQAQWPALTTQYGYKPRSAFSSEQLWRDNIIKTQFKVTADDDTDGYPNYKRIRNVADLKGSSKRPGEYQFATDFIDSGFNPGTLGGGLAGMPNKESIRIREIIVYEAPCGVGDASGHGYKWMPASSFTGLSGTIYGSLGIFDVKSVTPEYQGF